MLPSPSFKILFPPYSPLLSAFPRPFGDPSKASPITLLLPLAVTLPRLCSWKFPPSLFHPPQSWSWSSIIDCEFTRTSSPSRWYFDDSALCACCFCLPSHHLRWMNPRWQPRFFPPVHPDFATMLLDLTPPFRAVSPLPRSFLLFPTFSTFIKSSAEIRPPLPPSADESEFLTREVGACSSFLTTKHPFLACEAPYPFRWSINSLPKFSISQG